MRRFGVQRCFGQQQTYLTILQRHTSGTASKRLRDHLHGIVVQGRNRAPRDLAHRIQHTNFQRFRKRHGIFDNADLITNGGGLTQVIVIEDSAIIVKLQPCQGAVVQLRLHEQKQRIHVRRKGMHRRIDLLLAAFDDEVFKILSGLLSQPENKRADDPRYQQGNGQKDRQQRIKLFLLGHGCAPLSE